MSTCAPSIRVQLLSPTLATLIFKLSGRPSLTELSDELERMSERLSCSSTKYGPIVSSGRTTQSRVVIAVDEICVDETCVDPAVGTRVLVPSGEAHAARKAALPIPSNLRASLRLRI